MAPALPMSIWPAYFAFSSAITLPMSFILVAPTAVITPATAFFVIRQLLRHIGLDHRDLVVLSLRQFGPATLVIHPDHFLRCFTILANRSKSLDQASKPNHAVGPVELMSLSLIAAFISRSAETLLVARLHRVFHSGGDFVAKAHGISSVVKTRQ